MTRRCEETPMTCMSFQFIQALYTCILQLCHGPVLQRIAHIWTYQGNLTLYFIQILSYVLLIFSLCLPCPQVIELSRSDWMRYARMFWKCIALDCWRCIRVGGSRSYICGTGSRSAAFIGQWGTKITHSNMITTWLCWPGTKVIMNNTASSRHEEEVQFPIDCSQRSLGQSPSIY